MVRKATENALVLDASVVVAIVLKEPGYEAALERVLAAEVTGMGAPSMVEAMIVLSSKLRKDARPLVRELLRAWGTQVVPFTDEHADLAVQGFLKFGKGRHKAGLNFGDCMTYGVARESGAELAYCGVDFARTDVG